MLAPGLENAKRAGASCSMAVLARPCTPCRSTELHDAGERPPGEHYRNKCARLHNTTTSNSGRFDGARYRPLAGAARAGRRWPARGERGRARGKERNATRGCEAGSSLPISRGTPLYNLCLRMADTERRERGPRTLLPGRFTTDQNYDVYRSRYDRGLI